MGYTRGQIEGVAAKLRDMQPAGDSTVTTQAAIRELMPELVAMQKRGFTLAQIAAALASGGVNVAGSTLKTYMRRAGDGAKSKARRIRVQRSNSKAAAKVTPTATATTPPPKTPRGTFTTRADTEEI